MTWSLEQLSLTQRPARMSGFGVKAVFSRYDRTRGDFRDNRFGATEVVAHQDTEMAVDDGQLRELLIQARGMSDADRVAFVASITAQNVDLGLALSKRLLQPDSVDDAWRLDQTIA